METDPTQADAESPQDDTATPEEQTPGAPDPSKDPASDHAPAPKPEGPARAIRVLAVANQKGGVGKTTTVVNLAACLAELGQRILVVDLDPQSNATSGLGLPPQTGKSLYDVLLGDVDIVSRVQKTPIENIDIIPSELDLAGAEIDVARQDNYLHCFKQALPPLIEAAAYDFMIVDCPPSLGILTMNAMTAADAMIAPIQCEYYALEGLSVINRLIQQLRETGANPRLEVEGIVMTMFDSRTNLSSEVEGEVRDHFGDKVYRTTIPRNVRLSEAPSFGQPIIEYARHSTGARAYMQLAEEFLARRGIPVPERPAQDSSSRKIPLLRIQRKD